MTKRRLGIIGTLGALCATAAVAVFVPAASAVLPGDGGGGAYSCYGTYVQGGGPAACQHNGSSISFWALKQGSTCPYSDTYLTKVYRPGALNPFWTAGPFCPNGNTHYGGSWAYGGLYVQFTNGPNYSLPNNSSWMISIY